MARREDCILDDLLQYDGVEVAATTFATAFAYYGRIMQVEGDKTFVILLKWK